jgi:beta-glucanase (GH16 family)
MRAVILTVVVLSIAGCGSGGVVAPPSGWVQVWADEFNGAAGTPPDPASWIHDLGTGPNGDGWGNQQLEFSTDSLSNAAHDGLGNLVLTARREAVGNKQFSSARLITLGLVAPRYGRIEARIKLPSGQGLWPAFWMLGDTCIDPAVGWPTCGEIDILEMRGESPSTVISSLHGLGYSGADAKSDSYTLPADGGTFADDFHLFAVEWDPARIAFLVDGQRFQTFTVQDVTAGIGSAWAFDHPFFLILNVAVGGNFVKAPTAQTVFPQSMTVDYIRISRRAP